MSTTKDTTAGTTARPPLLLLCLAQFMLVLDFAIVNVAMPSVQRDLGFSTGELPWIVGAYALFFGGFLLVGGRAGDLVGRRNLFLGGLAVFTLASLVGGFATTPIVLIVARAVQGLSAAAVSPAVLALIAEGFPEGGARTKAMGIFGAVSSAGFTGGVLLGGILTQVFGWQSVMFVNVPAGIALIAVAVRKIAPDHGRRGTQRIDFLGGFLVTASMCSAIYGFTVASEQGWDNSTVQVSLPLSVVLMAVFLVLESKIANPLVPLGIFRGRSVSGGDAISFLSGGVMSVTTFFTSLYMQQVLDYSAIGAGIAFFPQAFIVVVASLPVVKLTARYGPRLTLLGGGVLLAIGSLVMTRIVSDGSFWVHILPGGLLLGLGVTVMMITTAVSATSGVPGHLMGLASGVYNSSRQMGVALCLAVAVAAAGVGGYVGGVSVESLRIGFWITLGLSVAIAVIAVVVLPRDHAAGADAAAPGAEPGAEPAGAGADGTAVPETAEKSQAAASR
ncbi:DHA2 family efflux MFS transporter permease subunit [Myceligenerans cantabricum]